MPVYQLPPLPTTATAVILITTWMESQGDTRTIKSNDMSCVNILHRTHSNIWSKSILNAIGLNNVTRGRLECLDLELSEGCPLIEIRVVCYNVMQILIFVLWLFLTTREQDEIGQKGTHRKGLGDALLESL